MALRISRAHPSNDVVKLYVIKFCRTNGKLILTSDQRRQCCPYALKASESEPGRNGYAAESAKNQTAMDINLREAPTVSG